MKWVSWATWAWEIFREIVDYLEPENDNYYDKKIIIPKDNKTDFLEIISPLDESVYKIDSNKPKNISQIKLDFKTNIDYDDYKWLINNNELDSNFLNTNEWNFEVKIELYKNWELIWYKISNIEILK